MSKFEFFLVKFLCKMNIAFVFIVVVLMIQYADLTKKTITNEEDDDENYIGDDFYDTSQESPLPLDGELVQGYKPTIKPKVKEYMKEFKLTNGQLREYERRLIIDLRKGLGNQTHNTAIVKCFVTYIQNLPTGHETGTFLAVDLGGTHFRVLMVELGGTKKLKMRTMQFTVPQEKMLGTGDNLFLYLANCIVLFVEKYNLTNPKIQYSMGFTFSFPLSQKSLNQALIQQWTKGFNCSDTVGQDVGKLLQNAIKRRGINNIKIKVVINDTTGTLISAAWKNPSCKIGLIIGTGSNACYVEKQQNAQLFQSKDQGSGEILINTEWGAFGDDGSLDFIRTKYDLELDSQTINPGRQLHEKMISGMYLGEIVRVILMHFAQEGILFGGKGSHALFTRYMFLTKYMSQIESAKFGDHSKCMDILGKMGIPHISDEDCLNVRYICSCVATRAAHMVSAGICALIRKMDEKNVAVGIDGSVYIYHPSFHRLMTQKIKELVMPGVQFTLMLSEDGSGRGAALAAAVAEKHY